MLALLAAVAALVFLFGEGSSQERRAQPAGQGHPAHPAHAGRQSDPAGSNSSRRRGPALPPASDPPATQSAVETAEAFARAYLAGQPVPPTLATPALVADLSASPGAPALEAEANQEGIQLIIGSVSATVEDSSPQGVGVSVVAQLELHRPGGSGAGSGAMTEYLDVLLVDTPGGWRVSQVEM